MLGTKPLENKSFHPESLRRIIHSVVYDFRGWPSRGRQQKPQGGDIIWSWSIWPQNRTTDW